MSDSLRTLIRESMREVAFDEVLVEIGAQHRHDLSGQAAAMDKLKDIVFGPPGEYTLDQIAKMVGPMNIPNLEKALDALTHKGLVQKRMTSEQGILYIIG